MLQRMARIRSFKALNSKTVLESLSKEIKDAEDQIHNDAISFWS
jgi:hypothetical protein